MWKKIPRLLVIYQCEIFFSFPKLFPRCVNSAGSIRRTKRGLIEFINLCFTLPTPSGTWHFVSLSSPPCRVANLVKVHCFHSSVLWGGGVLDVIFFSAAVWPSGGVCCSVHLNSHQWVCFFTSSCVKRGRHRMRQGGCDLRWDCCWTSLHWGQHFIKSKLSTHGVCVLRRKQALYKLSYCAPAGLPWKTPEQHNLI